MSFPNQDFHVCHQVVQRSRAWTQKKELADMNSISQHTNPGRSHRQMQQDRGGLAKLSRSTTLLPRLKSGILGLGAGPAGLLPGKTGFFFRAISCLHAVFVEFCSETQSQPITALFLVQISCSWRRATFDRTKF